MKKISKYIAVLFVASLIATFFVSIPTAQADLCSELSQSTGGFFSCGGQEATSFTQFQGGLQPPSAEGYDPTLTQQTNLRDFVVNAVNFVLGFLGLAAIIMIIYGGFMYLTAAGAEEKTTKGRKSVTYAIVGIVIILISFALVNTVIKGIGKGTDVGVGTGTTTGLSGAPEELTGDQTQAIQRLFFAAAAQVQRAAQDLATAYAHYVDVDDALADLEAVPYVDHAEQLHIFLGDIKRSLRNIITASGELSRTTEAAKYAEDYVDIFLRQSQQQLEDEWTGWFFDYSDQLQSDIDNLLTQSGAEGESIWKANLLDFANEVENILEDLDDLKNRIDESGLVTTAETDFGVAYARAVKALELLIPTGYDIPSNQKVIDALEALSELHTVVQNIQFVGAIISADIDTGNAPLIVNVDALDSIRPDYESISEEDIKWDFGDGTVVEDKFAASHVYRKTGSYIIKLTIKGDASKGIASGVAYKEISIKPPASQINLNVTIGDRELGYMSFYKDGFLTIDKNRLNTTLTEARDIGITFDASETRGGFQAEQTQEAGETYIQTISWTFGDGSDKIFGEMVAQDVQTHYYGETGTYPVIIEIEDSRGVKDRKVFEVVVDSPAARIDVSPDTRAVINEDVTFDAAKSSTDGGQITGYSWNVQNQQLKYSAQESTESFTTSFESPGVYNVSLKVTDNLGGTATDSTQLLVESKPPEAKFIYSVPDSSKPHIYFFDGTQSFDPDGNMQTGVYTYKWKVHAIDDDYDFIDPETGLYDPEGDINSRMYLKFYRTGEYKVTLDINDVNEPENPGVAQEQTVVVDSILDVSYGNLDQAAGILDSNNESEISFIGFSENAVAYEWDFGDGSETVSGDMIANRTDTSHIYTSAGVYDVELTVFDREDNENSVKRRIVIGEADSPLAVIALKVDGVEVYDLSQSIRVNRKTVLEFNAERSLNIDGTGRRLGYQWDFGDTQKSTDKQTTHTYADLSPKDTGYYTATLKVLDKNDLTKTSTAQVLIDVAGELPTMQAFTAVTQETELITPVRVKLEAIGANDPDGQIVKYLWWYYDEKDSALSMGHTITQGPQAFVTIGTRGKEGDPTTYKFGIQMTDQENFKVSASEILDDNLIPTVTVINGPNDVPVSSFNVDRTSLMLGESINFTSSSYDPDGKIISYIWDFEGDGFGNNEETTKSTIAHTYTEPALEGVNVRLKVIDNNYAESVSMPVKIFVDVFSEGPTAAFKIQQIGENTVGFINNSVADEESGAELDRYKWDFDIASELESADSDGDGVLDNDIDSQEANPIWVYEQPGIYRAKLIIIDTFGNEHEIVNFVNVKTLEEIEEELGISLKADFETHPQVNPSDNTVYLTGDFDEVSFDFSKSKGEIVRYVFDNNVYVDSNDNGRKADDVDYMTTNPGIYTTTFNPETEKIKVRLTIYDEEGSFDVKEVKVEFEENSLEDLQTHLLGPLSNRELPYIIVSLVLFGIISLSLLKLSYSQSKK
ncbi:PKD domain-containing protein [Patescibacteria group bacterium]